MIVDWQDAYGHRGLALTIDLEEHGAEPVDPGAQHLDRHRTGTIDDLAQLRQIPAGDLARSVENALHHRRDELDGFNFKIPCQPERFLGIKLWHDHRNAALDEPWQHEKPCTMAHRLH